MSDPGLPPSVRRLFRLPWRNAARVQRDCDDEVRFHIEMRADELVSAGISRDSAIAQALREFGDADDLRRHALLISSASRRWASLREAGLGTAQDLRFAARQIRRAPLFAIVAVLTLALGIGANSSLFSVIHHLVLAPLPYRDGDRIVELMESTGGGHILFATTEVERRAWRERARSLEDITTASTRQFSIGDGGARERVEGAAMEPNLMSFLGVHPVLGRTFQPNDGGVGATPPVILGYGLWQRRFAGRPEALGDKILVDDTVRTIIGVAPAALSIPMNEHAPAALWVPLASSKMEGGALAFAKLRRGVQVNQAERELSAIAKTVSDGPAQRAADVSIRAMRPRDFLGVEFQRALSLLFGAVSVVLLIACANVANLLLVRSWGRQREFAVRTALGASRGRLARQLCSESLMLAIAAGLVGLLLAWSGLHLFRAVRPVGLAELDGVRVEWAVLYWTGGLSFATAIVFGLFPTLVAAIRESDDWLRRDLRTAGAGGRMRRVRSALVVSEIALSVVLLIGAGLLVRSFIAIERVALGFDPRGLSSVSVQFAPGTPKEVWHAELGEFAERVRSMPGVEGAVIASDAPPGLGVSSMPLEAEGGTSGAASTLQGFATVEPDYFRLARIRLRGRSFGTGSGVTNDGSAEVIVNERLARRLWPNGDAIGRRLRAGPEGSWRTVVGVAQDVATPGRHGDMYDLQLYFPPSTDFPSATIMLRSEQTIDALAPTLRRLAASVDSRLDVWHEQSAETEIAGLLAAPRFATMLVGALGLAAFVLSGVGLYGVITYAVSQRTREIGVRVALGAEPRDIGKWVMRDGSTLALFGLTIGCVFAAVAGRAIESFLYGTRHLDAATYAIVALLLGSLSLVASYLPARRAMRVDPVVALSADS